MSQYFQSICKLHTRDTTGRILTDAWEAKFCEAMLAKAHMVKEKNNFQVGTKTQLGWESRKSQAAALGFGMGESYSPRECIEGSTALSQLQHLLRALVLLQHTYKSLNYLAKTDKKRIFYYLYYCLFHWVFLRQNLGIFPFISWLCTNYKKSVYKVHISTFWINPLYPIISKYPMA